MRTHQRAKGVENAVFSLRIAFSTPFRRGIVVMGKIDLLKMSRRAAGQDLYSNVSRITAHDGEEASVTDEGVPDRTTFRSNDIPERR